MAEAKNDKDPHTGFDYTAHFGVVSGSSIGKILQYSPFGDDERSVAESIFGISERKYTEAMQLGVKHEPLLVEKYIQLKLKNEGAVVTVEAAPIRTDPELPFLKATPDRDVKAKLANGRITHGVAEAKFKGGSPNEPVRELVRCPSYHLNQLQLEMRVSNVQWCDLIVGSTVNVVYLTVQRDPKWWDHVRPHIMKFYDDYLRWYWEGDRTASHLASLRALPNMTDQHYARITARQPPREASLQLQQLRKASNQHACST